MTAWVNLAQMRPIADVWHLSPLGVNTGRTRASIRCSPKKIRGLGSVWKVLRARSAQANLRLQTDRLSQMPQGIEHFCCWPYKQVAKIVHYGEHSFLIKRRVRSVEWPQVFELGLS